MQLSGLNGTSSSYCHGVPWDDTSCTILTSLPFLCAQQLPNQSTTPFNVNVLLRLMCVSCHHKKQYGFVKTCSPNGIPTQPRDTDRTRVCEYYWNAVTLVIAFFYATLQCHEQTPLCSPTPCPLNLGWAERSSSKITETQLSHSL